MLHELQSGLMGAVLANSSTETLLIAPKILGGNLTPAQRIAIYRRNVQATLRGALGDIFPTTHQMLGDESFGGLVDEFIRQEPSISGDLNQFGRSFPAFLQTQQILVEGIAGAADMARVDWAWHEAFHAAEHEPLDLSRLGTVSDDQHAALVFQLHPSACLIESAYPLMEIWQAHQATAYSPNEIAKSSKMQTDGHYFLIVHRDDADATVTLTPLTAAQYGFLINCTEDQPLGDAAERAFAVDASFALQDFLIQAVHQHIIVSFTEPS